ncbi:unnamed protein product [Arctogadus glacialis]
MIDGGTERELSATIAQLVQRLKGSHLHSQLERRAKDCLHQPEIKLESLKEDVRHFLRVSGWEKKLHNAVYREMHVQPPLSLLPTPPEHRKEPLLYMRSAQVSLSPPIPVNTVSSMSSELGVPLARKRPAAEQKELANKWNEMSTDEPDLSQFRPVYAPKDFLEVLIGLRNPNHEHSEQVSTRSHWGLIQLPLSVRDVVQMREMYSELGLTSGQLGIDDQANLHPDVFESQHVEAEKIKKKRSSLFGTLHVAHSSSLDECEVAVGGDVLYLYILYPYVLSTPLLLTGSPSGRKSLSEVTACLRERLHRWQQIEKLCGFPVVNNSGLPSLTTALYSDHSWVVMPRVSVPPYPIAGGVDDLDEDTPPMMSQFTSSSMIRPQLTRNSSFCRSRRSLMSSQSSSMLSQDPDLLSMTSTPLSYHPEQDGERLYFSSDRREAAQESYSDADSLSSSLGSSHGRKAPEGPYRKFSREELLQFSLEPPPPSAYSSAPPPSSASSYTPRDATPPPPPTSTSLPPTPSSGPPSSSPPSPALEHRPFGRGSPDLTRLPEAPGAGYPSKGPPHQGSGGPHQGGKGVYNGLLEKSYSFGQLPAGMLPGAAGVKGAGVGSYQSLTSLDLGGRGEAPPRLQSASSSQDSSDNGERVKRSKIKSLFKKKK